VVEVDVVVAATTTLLVVPVPRVARPVIFKFPLVVIPPIELKESLPELVKTNLSTVIVELALDIRTHAPLVEL
jgi:hypothetical protein